MVRLSIYTRLAVAILCASAAALGARDKGQAIDDDVQVCSNDSQGHEVCHPRLFNATDEFQIVLPGQDLPPGLHVQIDMSSGERLAKLMAPEPNTSNELAVVAKDNNTAENSEPKAGPRQRGFAAGYRPAAAVGFQAQVDLVAELASGVLSADRASQTEVLQKTLIEMEELVHDTRYADELIHRSDGAMSLLRLSDAQTAEAWPASIRQLASVVLGTCLQNNPAAQSHLFAAGAMPQFIANVVHEHDARALGKHVFALSALVRGNNQALAEFAGESLRGLRGLLVDSATVGDVRVRDLAEVRVVRLVEDVLNSELHPDFQESAGDVKRVFAESAGAWCGELVKRLGKELVAPPATVAPSSERPLAYAHALQLLRSQYPDNCSVSSELQLMIRNKVAQIGDSSADYRAALVELM
ncbi:nucleotide exchange factor sil1 [Coemansia sp. BCRC 34301]|nr:nucleotide exchange factor sil1 [Coemansia sp. BCRC 34301]